MRPPSFVHLKLQHGIQLICDYIVPLQVRPPSFVHLKLQHGIQLICEALQHVVNLTEYVLARLPRASCALVPNLAAWLAPCLAAGLGTNPAISPTWGHHMSLYMDCRTLKKSGFVPHSVNYIPRVKLSWAEVMAYFPSHNTWQVESSYKSLLIVYT